jgi:hypothetical protein
LGISHGRLEGVDPKIEPPLLGTFQLGLFFQQKERKMKVLKERTGIGTEEKENDYAYRIRRVEDLMRKLKIEIFAHGDIFVTVKNQKFRITDGYSFPRLTSDEKLQLWPEE